MADQDDEDAVAVLAVLLALRPPTEDRRAEPTRWGRPSGPTWETGPDSWWASGLPR